MVLQESSIKESCKSAGGPRGGAGKQRNSSSSSTVHQTATVNNQTIPQEYAGLVLTESNRDSLAKYPLSPSSHCPVPKHDRHPHLASTPIIDVRHPRSESQEPEKIRDEIGASLSLRE